MALNCIKKIAVLRQCLFVMKSPSARFSSLHEPDYLQTGKSKVPLLPTLNIQVKGYDYPVLESYQGFVHKLTDIMQIDIDGSWPLPPQEFQIQRYKPMTTAAASEYNLKIYERNMQASEISAIKCSVLIRLLEAALPQGVTLNVEVYDQSLEQKRFIPDKELLDLKSALGTLTHK